MYIVGSRQQVAGVVLSDGQNQLRTLMTVKLTSLHIIVICYVNTLAIPLLVGDNKIPTILYLLYIIHLPSVLFIAHECWQYSIYS